MRRLFGCPDIVSLTEKFLMARIFFRIFTENNPVMGDSKTFGIPEAKGLNVLTSSGRMTFKHSNNFRATDRRASIHALWFLCVFAGRLVNMPHVACHHGGWRVYTPSFLGVPGVTVGWPRTKGTASNERVHSFCGFLPNPFIQDLCLWRTSQEFVKTDLYPLSQGLWSLSGMSSVWPGTGR